MSSTVAPESWRLLTIVFVDVVGSTPLSVVLDGEDYVALIDRYQAITDPLIEKHDGFLGRDEGDGRFIWFGWPQSAEDDAERAIHMALELGHKMETLAAQIRQELKVDLAVRIGVHTGEIIVRETNGRPNLLGAAANVAAKVQAACSPGSVFISEATAELVRHRFDIAPVQDLQLDGLDGHLDLFSVNGTLEVASVEQSREIGRGRERAVLADHWRGVREGSSRTVLVVGEAGMGKTTLVRGFLHSFTGTARRIEIVGDDRLQNEAFAPLIQGLAACQFWEGSDYGEQLQTAATRGEALENILEQLERRAAQEPVLLLVEDAHWLDPSTSEALGMLVAAQLPGVFTLINTRLSSVLLGPDAQFATLALGPLPEDQLRRLIVETSADLEEALIDQLVGQTAGNPFFATELARSSQLVETGARRALLPHSEVPIVVQQSLRAQLDRSAEASSLASTAAVLGRQFDAKMLARAHGAIPGGSTAIGSDLDWLVETNIVSRTDTGFEFRHALVQQLAHDLPVRSDLKARHSAVADVLLEDGEASPARVGLHLDRAGRALEAAEAKLDAARFSRVAGAFREGTDLLDRVVELLEPDGESDSSDKAADKAADSRPIDREAIELEALELRSIFGAALDERTYNANPLDRERLNTLLLSSDDEQAKARALTRDWASAMVMSDLRKGGGLLRRLCHASKNDPVAHTMARHFRATHMMYRGNYRYAEQPLLETALDLAEKGLQPEFRAAWSTADDPVSVALSRVPPVLWIRGEWEQAEAIAEKAAFEAATIAGPSAAMAAAHVKANTALYHELSGNGHRTLELGGEIAAIGDGPGMAFWVQIGQLHQLVGGTILEAQPERLDQLLGAARSLETVARLFAPILYLEAARGYIASGSLSLANEALDGAQAIAIDTGARWTWPELCRLRAGATTDRTEKQAFLEDSLASAARQGARVIELRALGDLIELGPGVELAGSPVAEVVDRALLDFPSPDHYPEFARLVELLD